MTIMEGDALEGQPAEGVATLTDLAAAFEDGEMVEDGEDAPAESDEGEEEVLEEAEGEEVEQDEEEAEAEESEEEAEEPTVTLKHDGKEITLKQSEALELAQKGFDYTQKTMALAEERKAVDAVRTEVQAYRQEVEQARTEQINRLQALQSILEREIGTPPPVELLHQDTALYIAQKEQYEARREKLDHTLKSIAYLQQEQSRERQDWLVRQANETERALRDTLPGWNDNTLHSLASYAEKYGITPQTAEAAFVQKGLWELVHKAKAYDELQAKKAELKPVPKAPSKPAPPTARNQPPQLARRQEAVKRFQQKPSINTLADLI
jgi:hypothetical protein